MLLDHCYCPYIRTILKYVHHFANIAYQKKDDHKTGSSFQITYFSTTDLINSVTSSQVSNSTALAANSCISA